MAVARAQRATTAVNREREFDIAEMFFSTTDRKGVIVSGNDVFTRVSGWTEAELVGAPHNIIRHPDMPRVVFRLLWEYLKADRPIAAYVKNMAKDGSHYWVLATAVPLSDGYLSVRIKPSTDLLATVEPLYAELLGVERAIEEAGGKITEAMDASAARLMQRLGELGFATYDDFMRVVLPAELRSRQAALTAAGTATRGAANRDAGGTRIASARAAARSLADYRHSQMRILEQYEALHGIFQGKTEFVLQLADNVRLFSLNAQIGSARLADAGAALGVIADIMRLRSDATASLVRELSSGFTAIVQELGELSFGLAIATLQSEMTAQFIDGLAAQRGHDGASEHDRQLLAANVHGLAQCLRLGVGPALATLTSLAEHLGGITSTLENLHGEMRHLDALQVAGRVESARLTQVGEFRALFEEIRSQIATARTELDGLYVLESLRNATLDAIADASITRSLERLDAWAESVGRAA